MFFSSDSPLDLKIKGNMLCDLFSLAGEFGNLPTDTSLSWGQLMLFKVFRQVQYLSIRNSQSLTHVKGTSPCSIQCSVEALLKLPAG